MAESRYQQQEAIKRRDHEGETLRSIGRSYNVSASDVEMSELPVDPELAFVQFEKILRGRVQEMETQEADSQGFDADSYRLEYMNKVHAAAKVFGIEALANLDVPKADRNSSIAEQYRQFVSGVDYVTIQIRLHSARSNRQGSVGLDDTTRAKIHHFIKQIREAIGQSELPDDKRDALYDKLNKFATEVDKARTALQAGMAVYIAVCKAIGQGFQKLEPARKWVDSIGALLGRAKEGEDRADHRLPAPPERKRLEPPPERQVPKHPQRSSMMTFHSRIPPEARGDPEPRPRRGDAGRDLAADTMCLAGQSRGSYDLSKSRALRFLIRRQKEAQQWRNQFLLL